MAVILMALLLVLSLLQMKLFKPKWDY